MANSRGGRTKALYRGTKISFVRQVIDLFMKYNILLALLAAAKTLAEGMNAEFTVMPRSLICSHFCSDLPAASSDRAIRRSGVPPIDRWWLLLAFNGRSHPWDKLNACWTDDCCSCCWLLGAMSLTSSAKNKWLHVSSSAKSLINGGRPILL